MDNGILLESGDDLLKEDGFRLILEATARYTRRLVTIGRRITGIIN
jgi:hypothetical protein